MEDLVKEAESLVQKGVKEITLIAQELTYYGLDLYKKCMLAELFGKLADVKRGRMDKATLCFTRISFL